MSADNPKVTAEFCKKHTLAFSPATAEETIFIQRKLFALGLRWASAQGKRITLIDECIDTGMLVSNGCIYYHPSNGDKEKAVFCTSAQFDEPFDPRAPENAFVLPEHRVFLRAFNELSERMAAMEQKLDRLCAAVEPQAIDKPKSSPASLGPKNP